MDNRNILIRSINELIGLLKSNLDEIYIIVTARYSNRGWSAPPGLHKGFEIILFEKGSATLKIRGVDYPAQEGDIFFIDNLCGSACTETNWTVLFFAFFVKKHDTTNQPLFLKISQCLKDFPQKYSLEGKGHLQKIFMDIIREMTMKQHGYELMCNLLIIEALTDLLRVLNASSGGSTAYHSKKNLNLVSDITTFLTENISSNLTLAELGDMFRFNPRYLNKIFKSITGSPIIQYHQLLRIENAKILLLSTSLSVLEIALELGFDGSQHLIGIFKKITGVTPGKFRKAFYHHNV